MAEHGGSRPEADARERYRHLDEPVRADELVTSVDVRPAQPEKDDQLRETEWLLRNAAG